MGDDRPARYLEGDRVIYRASSLGACERALVALATGHQPRPHPQWFQDVLDEGTAMEPFIRAMHDDARAEHPGWQDQYEGEFAVGQIGGREVVVRYHADDVLIDGSDALLREYKKFRESTWDKFIQQGVECNANYPWQVAVMMHSLQEMGLSVFCEFIGGKYVDGAIVGTHAFPVIDPPIPRIAIIKKIARVERLIAEGLVPDEVPCQVRFPCGFWYLHDDKPEVPTVELTEDDQLAALRDWKVQAGIAKTAKQMLETAEKNRKAVALTLAGWISDNAVGAGMIDGVRVQIKRHVQEVEAHTQTVRAYTKDYFQEVKS